MKIPKIAQAVGEIDADLVSASARERRRAKQPWVKWSILTAACLCVVVLTGMIALPMMLPDDALPEGYYPTGKVVSFGEMKRHYKYSSVSGSEVAYDWPDEYLTVQEKHRYILWNLQGYDCSGITVQTRHLGDKLGNYLGFEVREIQGMPRQNIIALGMKGEWYVYKSREGFAKKPATFGELYDLYSLGEVLELEDFSKKTDRKEQYYSLADDAYVREVLADCRDGRVCSDDEWNRDSTYLSFSVTSDRLGVYKKVLYISEDGYLRTNVFEYAYVYEIGTEAAGKIIDYAMANSAEKATYEPYEYTLAGTVVEIKDGYVYIDDSVMCVKPGEGMVFRVSMEDVRIRRCIEYAGVGVGDLVVVTFRGGIAVEDGNLILDARSIDRGTWGDGGVSVPE